MTSPTQQWLAFGRLAVHRRPEGFSGGRRREPVGDAGLRTVRTGV